MVGARARIEYVTGVRLLVILLALSILPATASADRTWRRDVQTAQATKAKSSKPAHRKTTTSKRTKSTAKTKSRTSKSRDAKSSKDASDAQAKRPLPP